MKTGNQVKIGTEYNQFSLQNDHEFLFKLFPTVSLVGIFGHPVFYLICKSLGYYENLSLRIIASILYMPMLFSRKFNRTFIIKYSELVYAITLPFFFSFLLYANDQNLYWTLSMLFAGGAFGFLTCKSYRSLLMILLSYMLSFVFSNFFIKITPLSVFYSSITTILITVGCALIMSFLKTIMNEIVLMTVEMSTNQKFINDTNTLREIAEKNLKLQSEIHAGQRLKLVAEMSKGIAGELGNTLTVIRGQAFLMMTRSHELSQKNKLQTVCEIAEDAAANVRQLIDFPQLGISYQKVMSIKRLITDSIKLFNDDYPGVSVSIYHGDQDIFLDCSPSIMKICFYNLFRYGIQRIDGSDLSITYSICNDQNKSKLIFNIRCNSLKICSHLNHPVNYSQYTNELVVIRDSIRKHKGTLLIKESDIEVSSSIEIPYLREENNFFKIPEAKLYHTDTLSISAIVNSSTLVTETLKELITALGYSVNIYDNLQRVIETTITHASSDLFIIDATVLNITDDLLDKKWEWLESKPVVFIDYEGDRNLLKSTLLNNKIAFLQKPLDELSVYKCILQLQHCIDSP